MTSEVDQYLATDNTYDVLPFGGGFTFDSGVSWPQYFPASGHHSSSHVIPLHESVNGLSKMGKALTGAIHEQEKPVMGGYSMTGYSEQSSTVSSLGESYPDQDDASMSGSGNDSPKAPEMQRNLSSSGARFYCEFPGCKSSKGYSREYDLKRHETSHEEPSWFCGCCKYGGSTKTYKSSRKDHLLQHLRNKHKMVTPYPCEYKACYDQGTAIFSTSWCLDQHLIHEHGKSNSEKGFEAEKSRVAEHGEATDAAPEETPLETDLMIHGCRRSRDHFNVATQSAGGKRLLQVESKPIVKRGKYQSKATHSEEDVPPAVSDNSEVTMTFPVQSVVGNSSGVFYNYEPPDRNNIARYNSLGTSSCDVYAQYPAMYSHPVYPSWTTEFGTRVVDHTVTAAFANPYANATFIQVDQLALEEVPNVHPEDFLALHRVNGLKVLQDFLRSAMTTLAAISTVTYNTPTRTIKLRGSVTATKQAKLKLQGVLVELCRRVGLEHFLRRRKTLPGSATIPIRSRPKTRPSHECKCNGSDQIYALRAKEDSVDVDTWMNHVLPSLSQILGPRLGKNYTASLVRVGPSDGLARAQIRIQSPHGQSQGIKREIRYAVYAIYQEYRRNIIPLHFSKGRMMFLAGHSAPAESATGESKAEYETIEEDEEGEEREFPYFKRWWAFPGMGASIGMRCTRSVSATLGGYILVDNQLYMLTVDHFIQESQKNSDNTTGGANESLELTSPSLADIDDMLEDLEQSFRGNSADIGASFLQFGDRDITLNDLQEDQAYHGTLQTLADDDYYIRTVLQELRKDEVEFDLGTVVHRCIRRKRESVRSNRFLPINMAGTNIAHRMDWALCKVPNRVGQNRHRYCSSSDPTTIDYFSEGASRMGDGALCQDICDPEPNTNVHYVGRKSGRQCGQINAVPVLVCVDGLESVEWPIIPKIAIPSEHIVAGDSGAWILRDSDKNLVGPLWGWNNGYLFFTPIKEVFADIEDIVEAQHVCLPYRPLDPGPLGMGVSLPVPSNTSLICEVKKKGVRKPKPVKFSAMHRAVIETPEENLVTTSIDRLPMSQVMVSLPAQKEKVTEAEVTVPANPGSPVPSLVSSASSSPRMEMPSPTPRRSEPAVAPPRVLEPPRRASYNAVVIKLLSDGDRVEMAGPDQWLPVSLVTEPTAKEGLQEAERAVNRLSLQYILHPPSSDQDDPLFSPKRKSWSFPLSSKQNLMRVLNSPLSVAA